MARVGVQEHAVIHAVGIGFIKTLHGFRDDVAGSKRKVDGSDGVLLFAGEDERDGGS